MVLGVDRIYTSVGVYPIQGTFQTGHPSEIEVGLRTKISSDMTMYEPNPHDLRCLGLVSKGAMTLPEDSVIGQLNPAGPIGGLAYTTVKGVIVSTFPYPNLLSITVRSGETVTLSPDSVILLEGGFWELARTLTGGDLVAMHPAGPNSFQGHETAPVASALRYEPVVSVNENVPPAKRTYTVYTPGLFSMVVEGFVLQGIRF